MYVRYSVHHLNSSFCKDRTSPDYSVVFCLFITVFMNSTGRLFHRFMARKLFLITLGSVPLTCNIFISSYSLQLLLLSQLVGSFFLFFFPFVKERFTKCEKQGTCQHHARVWFSTVTFMPCHGRSHGTVTDVF